MSEKLKLKSIGQSSTSVDSPTRSTVDRPSQKEAISWARSRRYAMDSLSMDVEVDRERLREADMDRYSQEQSEIGLWNFALTTVSFCSAYAFYSKVSSHQSCRINVVHQEIAVGYLVGAIGGALYFRLLKKSVDGIGQGGLSALSAQPRLLIPVVLVMGCNRWNVLAAEDVGLHLELLPMLVGFFTYKAAVVGRQSLEIFGNLVSDVKR